jgi:hypothetical protein
MSAYGIPDPPPVVPPGFNPDNYVARLNHVANRFEIQPRSRGQFSQITPALMNPIAGGELKVSPPSRAPDWHPLLEKWGLQVFSAAGFVNSTAHRGPGEGQIPIGRLTAATGNGVLASAILDDPDTLRFFAGLMVPSDQMPCVDIPHIGKCPIYGPSPPLDPIAQADVYKKLLDMRRLMVWRLEELNTMLGAHNALRFTKPGLDRNGRVYDGARGSGYVVDLALL